MPLLSPSSITKLSCLLTFSSEPFLAAFFEEASKMGHFSVSLLICGHKNRETRIIAM